MNKDADLTIALKEPSPDAVEVTVLEVFDGRRVLDANKTQRVH
jgi:hypothetical protein